MEGARSSVKDGLRLVDAPASSLVVCKRVFHSDTMVRWHSEDMSDMPPRFDARVYSANLGLVGSLKRTMDAKRNALTWHIYATRLLSRNPYRHPPGHYLHVQLLILDFALTSSFVANSRVSGLPSLRADSQSIFTLFSWICHNVCTNL